MKHLTTNPVSAGAIMFGSIIAGMFLWAAYKPQAQAVIRTFQSFLFG